MKKKQSSDHRAERTLILFTSLPTVGGHTTTTIGLCQLLRPHFSEIVVLCKTMPEHGYSDAARIRLEQIGCKVRMISDERGRLDLLECLKLPAFFRKLNRCVFFVMAMRHLSVVLALLIPAQLKIYYHITHDLLRSTRRQLGLYSHFFDKIIFVSPVTHRDFLLGRLSSKRFGWCLQGSELPILREPIHKIQRNAPGVHLPISFGLLGRLSRAKGAGIVAEFAKDSTVCCDIHVAGIGEYAESFRTLSDSFSGKGVRVIFRGSFDAANRESFLKSFFSNIDYLIVPTLDEWESITMAILEALQHGVPVIATRTGGLRSFEMPELGAPDPNVLKLVDPQNILSVLQDVAQSGAPEVDISTRCRDYYTSVFGSERVLRQWLELLDFSPETIRVAS